MAEPQQQKPDPDEPKEVDRNELAPELRSVPVEQLAGALANSAKAKAGSAALHKRQQEEHDELVRSGKALDPIAAAKRCYTSGSSETESITGAGGGH
jgi:hypothetical protein